MAALIQHVPGFDLATASGFALAAMMFAQQPTGPPNRAAGQDATNDESAGVKGVAQCHGSLFCWMGELGWKDQPVSPSGMMFARLCIHWRQFVRSVSAAAGLVTT